MYSTYLKSIFEDSAGYAPFFPRHHVTRVILVFARLYLQGCHSNGVNTCAADPLSSITCTMEGGEVDWGVGGGGA